MANDKAWMTAEDRFGRNVRKRREELGMSQADLAAAIGERGVSLHPSAVAKIEARDAPSPRTVRLNEAEAISRALGVQLADLVGGPEQKFDQAAFLADLALDHKRQMDEYVHETFEVIRTLKDDGFDGRGEMPREIQHYRQRIVSALAQLSPSAAEMERAQRFLDDFLRERDAEVDRIQQSKEGSAKKSAKSGRFVKSSKSAGGSARRAKTSHGEHPEA